jgi:hypothetical protein
LPTWAGRVDRCPDYRDRPIEHQILEFARDPEIASVEPVFAATRETDGEMEPVIDSDGPNVPGSSVQPVQW